MTAEIIRIPSSKQEKQPFRAPEAIVIVYLIFQTAAVAVAVWNYGIFRIFLAGIFLGSVFISYVDEMKTFRAERDLAKRAVQTDEEAVQLIFPRRKKQKRNNRKKYNRYHKKR